MSSHVSNTVKSIHFEIKKLSKIRDFITTDVAHLLANAQILSRLDYCNSTLAGTYDYNIKRLQIAQNSAARCVFRRKKRDHATPLLQKLHWLPVKKRIDFKICTLIYKCLNGSAPTYLSNSITMSRQTRHLRSSSDTTKLAEPIMKLKSFGERAFSAYGPKTWNTLPRYIRTQTTLKSFKTNLKTYLFRQ